MSEIGDKDICYCGANIHYSGKYWVHTTGVLRHPGKPRSEKDKETVKPVPSNCKSCNAPVFWIGGKIVEIKKKVIVLPNGQTVSGHESHFAYCPQSKDWRKKKT